MSKDNKISAEDRLLQEFERAIIEVRTSLGAAEKAGKLPGPLMSLSTLIDRIECRITTEEGESAFVLEDDQDGPDSIVSFRANTLIRLIEEVHELSNEIESDAEGRHRTVQIAVNMFIVHELLHIRQNFPDFATVAKIKSGTGGLGLPMLDVAADTLSAYVSALIECDRTRQRADDEFYAMYVNCLMIGYVIGAFVYDGRTNPAKRQRLLGLVISAMLVQASLEGKLDRAQINESWTPHTPLMALDMQKAGAFNALVIDQLLGLLLNDRHYVDTDEIQEVWDSVGRRPIYSIMAKVARLLRQAKAITG